MKTIRTQNDVLVNYDHVACISVYALSDENDNEVAFEISALIDVTLPNDLEPESEVKEGNSIVLGVYATEKECENAFSALQIWLKEVNDYRCIFLMPQGETIDAELSDPSIEVVEQTTSYDTIGNPERPKYQRLHDGPDR